MKKTNRIKSVEPFLATRDQAERMMGEVAALTIQRNAVANRLDAAIQAARDEAEPQLAAVAAALKDKSDLLRGWSEANPDEFGKRKSITFVHGVLGFRTGTPKLKTLSGWTFPRVLEALKATPMGAAFVRIKEEVDKEGLIAATAQGSLGSAELRSLGCRVTQDETFFVEPRLEDVKEAA